MSGGGDAPELGDLTRVPLADLIEWWRRVHREHTARIMASIERNTAHWPEEARDEAIRRAREVFAANLESTTLQLAEGAARGMRMDDEPLH